jgi:hypothetical protein
MIRWSWLLAVLFCGCVSSELDLPLSHPANVAAPTTPLTSRGQALSGTFDALAVSNDDVASRDTHEGHDHAATPASAGPSADTIAPGGEPFADAKFTCPMHPEIVRAEPGTCPICGMKLVPVKPKDEKAKP